jgi:glycosyltransferase involved in cell wall biosynthesis
MIESMACGTPTIAFRCGSVPEVISNGVTGFIVETIEEAVNAVRKVANLDRAACRAEFMTRFSAPIMAQQYVKLYEASIAAKSAAPETEPTAPDTEIDTLLTL